MATSRALRLRTVTDKASIQALERVDCPMPFKFLQKPMVELIAGSNVWYQGYVMKESANEAKVRFPGRRRTSGTTKCAQLSRPCMHPL